MFPSHTVDCCSPNQAGSFEDGEYPSTRVHRAKLSVTITQTFDEETVLCLTRHASGPTPPLSSCMRNKDGIQRFCKESFGRNLIGSWIKECG